MQWSSETVYVSSPAKLHGIFEFQHRSCFQSLRIRTGGPGARGPGGPGGQGLVVGGF